MNEHERPDPDGVHDIADVGEKADSEREHGSGHHAAKESEQAEPEAATAGRQADDTAAEVGGPTAGAAGMTGLETPTVGRAGEESAAELSAAAAAGVAGMTGLETPAERRAAEETAAEVSGPASGTAPFAEAEAEATMTGREAELSGAAAAAAPQATPAVDESVRRAAERAELAEANAASAAELGAAGLPEAVAHPGRTLVDMVRDKPILAAAPAAVLAFILWRAVRGR
ncbi:hypothetical protein AB0M45_22290 [Nocardia sp. NPDC051787]|uniref:hypothetical protein n=1 Tax=Nocardia sp. NPDC051787 TaxID=3155415 RepID=UPI003419D734